MSFDFENWFIFSYGGKSIINIHVYRKPDTGYNFYCRYEIEKNFEHQLLIKTHNQKFVNDFLNRWLLTNHETPEKANKFKKMFGKRDHNVIIDDFMIEDFIENMGEKGWVIN